MSIYDTFQRANNKGADQSAPMHSDTGWSVLLLFAHPKNGTHMGLVMGKVSITRKCHNHRSQNNAGQLRNWRRAQSVTTHFNYNNLFSLQEIDILEHLKDVSFSVSLDMNIVVTVADDCNVRIWDRSRKKASANDKDNVFKFHSITQ